MKLTHALTAAAATTALAASASADVLAADSFDYPVGPIAGQNGGTGFAGPYSGGGQVAAPGLEFGELVTSGNTFNTGAHHQQRRHQPLVRQQLRHRRQHDLGSACSPAT